MQAAPRAGDDRLIRPATLDDVPIIRMILTAHDNDGPVTSVDIVGPYLRHCIQHAIAFVTVQRDSVVAYGAAVDTGVVRHLADLFVRPDLLGRGVGRPLLETVMRGATHRTTFASPDPRALPLYIRAGMAPLWPGLHLEGDGSTLPALEPPFSVEPAGSDQLADLESSWTGAERPADHAFWATMAAADAFVVLERGDPVAFAYARARQMGPTRAIGRLVVRPGVDPVVPTLAAIRRGARGGGIRAFIPGPSPVVPALLAARFRITGRDQFMASSAALVDPARLCPDPGML